MDRSLPAKLSLVHRDPEANFLNKSQNCSRVGVFTQKLIFYGNAYVTAVATLSMLQYFVPYGISQRVLWGTPGWWGALGKNGFLG